MTTDKKQNRKNKVLTWNIYIGTMTVYLRNIAETDQSIIASRRMTSSAALAALHRLVVKAASLAEEIGELQEHDIRPKNRRVLSRLAEVDPVAMAEAFAAESASAVAVEQLTAPGVLAEHMQVWIVANGNGSAAAYNGMIAVFPRKWQAEQAVRKGVINPKDNFSYKPIASSMLWKRATEAGAKIGLYDGENFREVKA